MGQKVNPKAFRLGITEEWDSTWYDSRNYSDKVMEDFKIRSYLKVELARAGVSRIQVLRKSDQLEFRDV